MATFESKFNIGDRVCFLDSIIQWANGTKDEAKVSEIDAAKAELSRVDGELEELFWTMGTVGKDRVFQLLEAK